MNCMAKCLSWAIDEPIAHVYSGIGHCEPIHMDEILAYCLTKGFALVPYDVLVPEYNGYRVLVEGVNSVDEPHMIGLDSHTREIYDPGDLGLVISTVYWYIFPCEINDQFKLLHASIRDRWAKVVSATWGIA